MDAERIALNCRLRAQARKSEFAIQFREGALHVKSHDARAHEGKHDDTRDDSEQRTPDDARDALTARGRRVRQAELAGIEGVFGKVRHGGPLTRGVVRVPAPTVLRVSNDASRMLPEGLDACV